MNARLAFPDLPVWFATAHDRDPQGAAFDGWARRLFAHQFGAIPAYRRYCEGKGVTPGALASWEAIPAVATDLFRRHDLCAFPPVEAVRVFRTSGTTAGERGRHLLGTLTYYEASLEPTFVRHVLGDGVARTWIVLVPDAADQPDSSLSHMVSFLRPRHAAAGSAAPFSGGRLDVARAWRLLAAASRDGRPILVFGTALAFADLFAGPVSARGTGRVVLPEGSLAVETGGFKGRSVEITRDELYEAFEERLGLPPAACLAEYGMTELGSQLYARARGPFRGPPWLRARAVDPATGRIQPPDARGVLRFFDLANAETVLAVQTHDVGAVDRDGGLTLLGRLPGAPLRGCSLTAEDWALGGDAR